MRNATGSGGGLAMRIRVLRLAFALVALAPAHAFAAALGPEALVRAVTAQVLEAIRSDPDLQAGDRKKMLALAEEKVLPHVDFQEATRLAVGRAWASATPVERAQLVAEFRAMLVRVYSAAIERYRGQTMEVLPVRVPADATEAVVRNRYLRPGAPPVPVEYAMRKTPDGWKIYDVRVEGVSLVLAWRAEFEAIAREAGIEGLIRRLREKNR
ncbi:MAG: ABC transporter substrate-binding protein [Burkholderiales bacterium]|nr:ABC transporter substrate-binding protein [Burkholderiales bacterium]